VQSASAFVSARLQGTGGGRWWIVDGGGLCRGAAKRLSFLVRRLTQPPLQLTSMREANGFPYNRTAAVSDSGYRLGKRDRIDNMAPFL
jgi:hypothetical protein